MFPFPDRQVMMPAQTAGCLPLSQQQHRLFMFRWMLFAYCLIAVNVIVLMLLGVDLLKAAALALATAFVVAGIARWMISKSSWTAALLRHIGTFSRSLDPPGSIGEPRLAS